jgi:hypothetical protein
MTIEQKIRQLINAKLREIHENIAPLMSMGDIAVYLGQPMEDAMHELAGFVQHNERQRAIEISDLTLERMPDRELIARAIRNPLTKHPSQ